MGGGQAAATRVDSVFVAVGCNRAVGAVAWGPCNLVAFGAHHSVAIFSPEAGKILGTLPGHKDFVNCVLWLPGGVHHESDGRSSKEYFLLSGSADGGIILWRPTPTREICGNNKWRAAVQLEKAHNKAVTCMAALMVSPSSGLLASTSSDSQVRIWKVSLPSKTEGDCAISSLQSISVGARAMVAASLTALPGGPAILLALGGLDSNVHIYAGSTGGQFSLVCQVKGHQDWIRALDFRPASPVAADATVFLASASQDKTVKIWKISRRDVRTNDGEGKLDLSLKSFIDGPIFKTGKETWHVSLESLLLGHEDWVYSVKWNPNVSDHVMGKDDGGGENGENHSSLCLLSASMDRTMMIWKPDTVSGIWINEVTVGELVQSALGFFGGVWNSSGDAILANGYGGSLHLWQNMNLQTGEWRPQVVPSGHSAPVVDIAWAKNDQFLLSASHDQTARLFACWDWEKEGTDGKKSSWHEIGRPQVHGHDLSCLAVIKGPGNHSYVSGAEEKVARVFGAPGALLDTLNFTTGGRVGEVNRDDVQIIGANMSALGLSQKPIYAQGDDARSHPRFAGKNTTGQGAQAPKTYDDGLDTMGALPDAVPAVLTVPPLEEHLAQNTLWPELHKLYGHGNELFAMCCDHAGTLVASACKAQSATFAQIWLWQVGSWRPVGQLESHVLTVTQLEFAHNDRFLLSVSRDRHLSLFVKSEMSSDSPPYLLVKKIEGHKRIIWTCSWSCCDRFFATGSRDKVVKIWTVRESTAGPEVECTETLPVFKSGVTALAWGPGLLLAVGMEDGSLELWQGKCGQDSRNGADASNTSPGTFIENREMLQVSRLHQFDRFICHAAAVNKLAWKGSDDTVQHRRLEGSPVERERGGRSKSAWQLASCGADNSVRIFNVAIE